MREELGRIVRDLHEALRIEAETGPREGLVPRAEPRPPPAPAGPDPEDALAGIAAEVRSCTRCPLHRERRHAVPGEGDPRARLLLVGEAPGHDEDRQGRPFVGRAGQLLTDMLAAIGIRREEVFIANVLKCRPPGNRDPRGEEIALCQAYLRRQIAAIRPQVILTLGRYSAQLLLGSTRGILSLRGIPRPFPHEGGTAVLFPTLHPSYLLRNPPAKREAWEDLQAVHRILRERNRDWPGPIRTRGSAPRPD